MVFLKGGSAVLVRINSFWRGVIKSLSFVAIIIALGAVSATYYSGSITFLIIVAALFYVLSIVLSRKNHFDREAVDFVYYSVGLFGVVLFFAVQGAERFERKSYTDLLEVSELRAVAKREVSAADSELKMSLSALALVPNNSAEFLNQIQVMLVDSQVGFTEAEMEACAPPIDLRIDYLDREANAWTDNIISQNKRGWKTAICESAQERVLAAKGQLLAEKLTIRDLLSQTDFLLNFGERNLTVLGQSIPVRIAVPSLFGTTNLEDLQKELVTAKDKLSKLEKNYDALRRIVGKNVTDQRVTESSTLLSGLTLYIWPYVLLSLLCLKLSRHRK